MDNQNYLNRLRERLADYRNVSEIDAEEIVKSMKLARMNTSKELFSSRLFTKLMTDAFDATVDMPHTLRKGSVRTQVKTRSTLPLDWLKTRRTGSSSSSLK